MTLIHYDYQILKLTGAFYETYPRPKYIEILKKEDRPYNCIIFEVSNDYFICIPYRTEINHTYAYRFKNSSRSIKHKSGLDYSKMVIINNISYLDKVQAIVDVDEYKETIQNISRIKDEALDFLNTYIKHVEGLEILHPKEYKRRYQYSPLPYFHKELAINIYYGKEVSIDKTKG